MQTIIEQRRPWERINDTWSNFECDRKPESWLVKFRILVLRQKKTQPTNGPLQLDLFEPKSHLYEYQAIVVWKESGPRAAMDFHHGRGSQEGIFAEAKSHCQMEYVPVRGLCGNQVYCWSAVLARNLTRELQMQSADRQDRTTPKRRNLWGFETLGTLRQRLIRPGRLIRPQGCLTPVLSGSNQVRQDMARYLGP